MIKQRTHRRLTVIALSLLLAAVALTAAFLPRAQAAECGNGDPGGVSWQWLITPESQAHTDQGLCGTEAVCRQWCLVTCDDIQTFPEFRCFAQ